MLIFYQRLNYILKYRLLDYSDFMIFFSGMMVSLPYFPDKTVKNRMILCYFCAA
jgi:hypothetical protein